MRSARKGSNNSSRGFQRSKAPSQGASTPHNIVNLETYNQHGVLPAEQAASVGENRVQPFKGGKMS